MGSPLVTVLTPTYRKHRDFIRECIQSVVDQSYDNWELLVRDDGSLGDLVEEFGDERIRYSSQAPHPVWVLYETYNTMIAEARGDLFAVLEGDDRFPPDKLATQVEIHRNHPEIAVSFGVANRIDDRGSYLSTWGLTDRTPAESPFDARAPLLFGSPICAVTAMIPRWAFELAGGYSQPEGMPFPDYPTWMELAKHGPFYASRAHLGDWRVHDNSSTEHIWAVAHGGRRLALAHADGLDVDRRELDRYWSEVESDVLAVIGRDALERREWRKARSSFARALGGRARRFPPAPGPTVKAAAGLALAALRLPVLRRG